jgi:hypothetical protein
MRDGAMGSLAGPDGATPEGRYRAALVRLAPLAGRDAPRARRDLATLAGDTGAGAWRAPARYALAWIEESEGEPDRASLLYRSVFLNDPEREAGRRAGAALSRLLLRAGRPGDAAACAQAVVDRGGGPGVAEIREAAVRAVLVAAEAGGVRDAKAARTWSSGLRSVSAIARSGPSDLIVADRRRGVVSRFSADGRPIRTWSIEGVAVVAVDIFDRIFASAGETIFRLDDPGPTVVARTGSFGPPAALAADPSGRLWLADRRGERVAVIEPGRSDPRVVRAKRSAKVRALAWDGARVLAFEENGARVVAIDPSGGERTVAEGLVASPIAFTADAAGRFALLDGRDGSVVLADAGGRVVELLGFREHGVERPSAIALGADGSMDFVDAREGRLVRLP